MNFLKDFIKNKHKGYLLINQNEEHEKNEKIEKIETEIKEEKKDKEEEKIQNQQLNLNEKKNCYYEFTPLLFKQQEDKKFKEFESFDMAVDEFFGSVDVKSEKNEFEQKAWKKFENIKVKI